MRALGAVAVGTATGLALSSALFYLWLRYGSAPHTDGIISI